MTLSAGTRLGSYEILAPLGAGGMGEVYRARDARLGREVALKVLPEEVSRDRDRLARFEQEARSASALNHPNIVTVYDVGESGEISYIAMELVDGKTLRELLLSGPLPVRRVLSIAAQAAEGLAKAHAAGIVHRDLKPENLMVSKDGYVKVLDFGLARRRPLDAAGREQTAAGQHPMAEDNLPTVVEDPKLTEPGTVLGTVGYMSPEQASGHVVDYHSDQFSLGSILYEAVGGQKAFQKNTAAETMSAIIRDDPEPLGKLRPDAPLLLRWIIERCLAKDPEERYASTRDLARDLASVRDRISEVTSGAEAIAPARVRGRGRLFFPALAAAGLVLLGVVLHALLAPGAGRKPAASAPSFHRLTFRRGEIQNARFASDGQTVVYGGTWDGEPSRLYLTRAESPESRPFDFGSDTADILAVSSSGEMAILLNQGAPLVGGLLARVPMAGGVPRKVLEGVTYAGADWAPNGKDLIVSHVSGGRARLELPIGNTILNEAAACPRFSPAGDRVAFFSENGEVAIIDRLGKGRRTISSGWARLNGAPCWRSDGGEIWFTAAEMGQMAGLWAVDLQGKRRLVTRVPGELELDDLSRDGRVLVAHHTMFRIQAGLAPGEQSQRDLSWLDGSYPTGLSPDGKTLLFNETAEGGGSAPSVYLRKTDGSPPVRLGEGTGIALSPDGNWVLASTNASADRRLELVLLPTGPGQARALKSVGFESFGAGAWLSDGQRIVFSATQAGRRSRLYVQDLSGEPKAISPEGVQGTPSMLSPDGRFAVGMESPGKGSLYPLDGGEARPIAGLEGQPIGWSADGKSLYAHRASEIPNRVWRLDPANGQKRLWLEIKPREPSLLMVYPLLLSGDGKSYVYGSRRVHSALYIIEGLR